MRHWLFLLVVGLGLAGEVRAQAPDSVANTVISYNVIDPMGDHRNYLITGWLRPDGVFEILWWDMQRVGVDFGPGAIAPEHWLYTKQSATAGILTLYPTGADPTSPSFALGGSALAGHFALAFASPTAGTMSDPSDYISGSFGIRPAQAGQGPANLSTLMTLPAGGSVTSGFVLPAGQAVLVRAVGAGLGAFGVTNPATDATALVAQAPSAVVGQSAVWNQTTGYASAFNALFSLTGAFPLNAAGGDQALFLNLPAGAYSVTLSSKSGGQAMLEVYFLP